MTTPQTKSPEQQAQEEHIEAEALIKDLGGRGMNIRKLLGLCEHEWRGVGEYRVGVSGDKSTFVATEYHQQCAKCKKMRKFTL